MLATTTMSAVLLISLFIFICIGFSSLSCLLNATGYFHACAQTSTAVVPDYSRMSHSFPEVSTDDSGASRSCSCGLGACFMYRRFTGRKSIPVCESKPSQRKSIVLPHGHGAAWCRRCRLRVRPCGCHAICIEVVGRKAKRRSERALLLRGLHRSRCCCGS